MTDQISLGALIVAIISAILIFLKYIRKCVCNRSGIEIERDNPDKLRQSQLEEQQKFTLELIRILKNYTPRKNPPSTLTHNSQINIDNIISPEHGAAEIARSLNLEPKFPNRLVLGLFKKSPTINNRPVRNDTRINHNDASSSNNTNINKIIQQSLHEEVSLQTQSPISPQIPIQEAQQQTISFITRKN